MSHITDGVPSGGIVSIRDGLIDMQGEGKKVFRLESGDPSFDTPEHVKEAISRAIRDGHTHYTAGTGIKQLREAVLEKVTIQNKLSISSINNIFVTNGAMNGLYVTFRAMLSPGDEVIIPDPCWTETADNIRLAGGVPVYGHYSQPELWESLITIRTKAVVINSPQNPTGLVYTKSQLEKLVEMCDKHNLTLVSDEAYEDILFDREHVSPDSLTDSTNVVSIYSFSKSHAMSGLRLGYVVTMNPVLKKRIAKLLRCTINGVNSATQWGGIAALTGSRNHIIRMNKEYEYRRDVLYEALNGVHGLYPDKPKGAFYIWAKVHEYETGFKNAWDVSNHLVKRFGIGSAPGNVFGSGHSKYIRFAFSCSSKQVEDAANILSDNSKYWMKD